MMYIQDIQILRGPFAININLAGPLLPLPQLSFPIRLLQVTVYNVHVSFIWMPHPIDEVPIRAEVHMGMKAFYKFLELKAVSKVAGLVEITCKEIT